MPTTLTELLQQSATRFPDHCAYRFGKQGITFRELNQQASALGSCLIKSGVKVGDRIGILLNRSIDSILAVYGVIFSGAAYVPIDNTAPKERINSIIKQCQIDVVITHSKYGAQVDLAKLNTICIDQHDNWSSEIKDKVDINTNITGNDIAYIIFTSGSTGTPKGIVHTHASAVSFAKMISHHYGLQSDDRVTGLSPLHFDMSIFDLFAADYVGACTILFSEAHQKIAASLTQLAESESVTVWYSTPSSLTQSLSYGALEQRDLSSIRWVIYAGEPFPGNQIKQLMHAFPNAQISNAYGPAEVNVCHSFEFPSKFILESDIPIGTPCPGVTAKVVDEFGNDSNQGELWVSSPTMMLAYWNTPELTHKCITGDKHSKRFYQTGDFVQVSSDGLYYFLGRKDRQVKLRGFRIELEEIEKALTSITGVVQSNVAIVKNRTNNTDLCADVLLDTQTSITAQQISVLLSNQLPVYAIPKTIKVRSEFPLTSSGKTDRRKLTQQWQESVKED